MNKKSNAIVYIIILVMIVCFVLGVIGLLANKKGITNNKEVIEDTNYKITYKYYLDNEEVKSLVEQNIIEMPNAEFEGVVDKKEEYSFDKAVCTNNVKGAWNEEKWEYVPELTANTTCRLYFVRNFHNVTITAVNGVLPNNEKEQSVLQELNKPNVLAVLPTPGYKYVSVECTNDVKATYDESKSELTINSVVKDSVCTLNFGVDQFNVEIEAANGTIKENKKTVNFNENAVFEVTPNGNYGNPQIKCDNNQNGSFSNNQLIVNNVSSSTKCTIEFKPLKFNVSLKANNATLLSSTPTPQSVGAGEAARFGISPNEGYDLNNAEYKCNDSNAKITLEASVLSIINVYSDLSCEITLKEVEE